ncbi:MAG: hypothetical protein ACHQDE_10430, partial [Acidimicrobiia bacterium]
QAQYDPNNPYTRITVAGGLPWFLNFDANEGFFDGTPNVTTGNWCGSGTISACLKTDGNDTLFGDLGNDWQVGGTGRDMLFGGWGNDLLNADDNLNTGGSALNLGTDTNPSYEDLAFGGAGRDVLIANTGGDRLIDWIGEFDSYLVPFAPFGEPTVSRTNQPQLPEFLYALAASEGADPFIAQHYGSDPTRNGEPYGELGLVRQQDTAWGDQHGAPRDPQAGNTPGGKRDVRVTSGLKPINSPGTDPPAPGTATITSAPAAPIVEMNPYVSSDDQTLATLVVTGMIGATVNFRISNGAASVTGTGLIGADGKLSVLVDVSSIPDGTLTATATLTL